MHIDVNTYIYIPTLTHACDSLDSHVHIHLYLQTHNNSSKHFSKFHFCISPHLHRKTTNILDTTFNKFEKQDIPYVNNTYLISEPLPQTLLTKSFIIAEKETRWRWGQCTDLGASRSTNPILVSSSGHCLDGKISPSTVGTRKKMGGGCFLFGGSENAHEENPHDPTWCCFGRNSQWLDVFARTKVLLLEMICFFGKKPMDVGPKMLRHRKPPHSNWNKVHRVHEVKGHIGHIHGWIIISCHLSLQCPGTTTAAYCPLDP